MIIPVSAIIPTSNRSLILGKLIESIAKQNVQPFELIIVDASGDELTLKLCEARINGLESNIYWRKALEKGAAVQRNQGVKIATCDYIIFMDDDIILADHCIENLWNCIKDNDKIGGANVIVTNQKYSSPGKMTRFMYQIMSGEKLESYAGKCIGPCWNILPDDSNSNPNIIPVEWLNTTCTLYRKNALPNPPFPDFFYGYSLLEDVCLSLTVGKNWKICTVKSAKIFHNSQTGEHKNNIKKVSKMELINRYYIMKNILKMQSFKDYFKLAIFEIFQIVSQCRDIKKLFPFLFGKLAGTVYLIFNSNKF